MNLAVDELGLPVRIRPAVALTDEQLERFSHENSPLRIERDANGELIVMSPTGSEGGRVDSAVGARLAWWAEEDGRGLYLGPSTGFTLPDTSVRAADAAWMSWNRWNSLSRSQRKGFAKLVPEFVIEVRSGSDGLTDLREKMRIWIANGVELGWLIDPERRVAEIYRPGEAAEELYEPSSVQGDGPVQGFELAMQRIWE